MSSHLVRHASVPETRTEQTLPRGNSLSVTGKFLCVTRDEKNAWELLTGDYEPVYGDSKEKSDCIGTAVAKTVEIKMNTGNGSFWPRNTRDTECRF